MPVDIARIQSPERLLYAAQAVVHRAELALRENADAVCKHTYQSFVSEGRQLILQAERLLGESAWRLFGQAQLLDDPVCNTRMPWRFHLEQCLQVLRQLVGFIESSVKNAARISEQPNPCVTVQD